MKMHASLADRARSRIPGGVNSPVRAFRSVGGNPIFVRSASGSRLKTCEGRELVDFCMSFGPLILGHAHPVVVEAIQKAAELGTSFAVTTEAEMEMAELICTSIPVVEKVRLVNSGTEAVMTALRLARGFTGRSKILKFTGCYHGHTDSMLVQAGSGVVGIAEASSAGVTRGDASMTLLAPYNDLEAATAVVTEHGADLAAIIVEPVAGNMGLVEPLPGYLKHLRELADQHGALLIFDEVISGFRTGFGGFSNGCCAKPDLTTLGKIIGGGLPIGALGGKAEIMDHLAPDGPVYQAGTLSGNPVSVASGLATLRVLRDENPYPALEQKTRALVEKLKACAQGKGVPLSTPSVGSLFGLFFSPGTPRNFEEVKAGRTDFFAPLFHALLERGYYLPPSAFEANFLSTAHTEEDLDGFIQAFGHALEATRKS